LAVGKLPLAASDSDASVGSVRSIPGLSVHGAVHALWNAILRNHGGDHLVTDRGLRVSTVSAFARRVVGGDCVTGVGTNSVVEERNLTGLETKAEELAANVSALACGRIVSTVQCSWEGLWWLVTRTGWSSWATADVVPTL
jgi:hypothetical protein